MIRDEQDMRRHIDYTHYNPVKHGLVGSVLDWRWSSFHRYVKMGHYEQEWGGMVWKELEEVSYGE
jgi:putative transposase